MKRATLDAILVAEVVCIFGLLMLLVAGSRLTDFDYLAERYQSLISAVPNAFRLVHRLLIFPQTGTIEQELVRKALMPRPVSWAGSPRVGVTIVRHDLR